MYLAYIDLIRVHSTGRRHVVTWWHDSHNNDIIIWPLTAHAGQTTTAIIFVASANRTKRQMTQPCSVTESYIRDPLAALIVPVAPRTSTRWQVACAAAAAAAWSRPMQQCRVEASPLVAWLSRSSSPACRVFIIAVWLMPLTVGDILRLTRVNSYEISDRPVRESAACEQTASVGQLGLQSYTCRNCIIPETLLHYSSRIDCQQNTSHSHPT